MAGQGDVLFGRLAVEKMFCSEEQVREALAAQSEGNGSPRLGDILIERGYLSPAQRERVLAAQEAEAFNETNGLFGHLAVKNGLARQEHVDECLALQKRMFPAKKAATPHLGELLVERGYMSAPDSRAVLRAQERLAAKRAEASRAALLGKPRPQRTEGAGTSGVRMARPVPKPDEVQRMSATGFFEAPTGVPREDREDRRFSRLAVERGLVTKEQVEQVCVIQRGLLAKGKNVRFGVLCTAKGLLSLDQVKSLMAEVTAAEASAIASSSALGLVGASSAAATRHAPDAAGSADATVISPPPAPPPVPGAPAGGAITCVFCGAGYPLNGRAPGDVFSCSGCGAQITVPGAGAPATPTLPALEEKMALAAGTEADDDDFGGNFDNDSARWMKVDLSEKAEVPPPLPGEGSGGNGAKKASISADGTVVTMPPEAVEEKWEDFDDAGGDTVAAPVADGAPVTGSSSNATVVLGDPAESGASAGSTVVAGLGGSAVTILFDTPGTVAGPDGQRTVATAGAGGTAAVAVAPEKKKPEIFIPRAPKDGKRIGEYTILRELGRGAMGVVYEAVQEGLGRRVALKILPANLSTNEKIIERFRREAASVAKLKHEHIIPVYGMGEEEGTHYFAMEFVDGRSLEDVISKERLDLKTGVQMMIQAADALAYAHGKGVVHRDIKPANLMVTWAENKVMVADFGLAREEEQASMTRSGQIMGSPAYMPPEQAMGSKGLVGPWSDQYSLGTTMYELFTLTRAFPGEDIHEVIRDVIEKEPVPPRRANEKVPRDLETIILKAMEKVKEKRYVDCGVLAQDLRAFLEGDPISAKPITFAERIYRKLKKHKAITAISTAAVLVLGSGGAYVWVSARNQALEVRREVNKLLADAGDCVATHARLQQEMEANKAAWDFPQKINAAEDQAAALNDAKTALTTAAGKEKDNEEVKRQADYVRDEIIRVDTNLNSLKEQLAKARDEREQRAKSNAFVSEAEKSLAVDTLDDVEKARNLVRNALVVWAENPKALTLREQVETRYKALEEESRLKEARAKAKARYDAGLIPFASAKESLDHGEPSLAEAAEINNNFRTAVSEFDVALSIFPRDIDAGERMYLCHYLRAQMYSRLHRFDLADEMVLSADSTLRKIDNLREEVNKAAVEAKPGEPEAAKPRSEAEKAKAEEEGAFRDQLNALAERMRGEIAQLKETVQRDRNYNEIYKAALDEAKDMEAKGNWDAGRHALTRARKVAAKEDVAAIDRQARSIEKSEKEREAEIAEKTADWDKAAGLYRKAKGFVEAADEAARQKLEGKAVDCLMKKRRAFLDQAVKAFNNEAWRQAGDYARDTLAVRLADPAEVAAGAGGDATGAGDAPELDAATAARAREIAEESRRFNSKQQDEQYVPGGNFHYGSMRAGDHNDPGDAVVGAFYIDTYEVRNGDYYKFVADGGYENAAWWDAEIVGEVQFFVDQDDKPGPATWFGGTFPAKTESMPVAGVSWWEARAYARWFSAQQLARRLLPKKLPTDHQWEKAAAWDPRANRAHTYAFGDAGEWSLTKGHFAAEMRPVDVGFRQFDRSHYGVQDMTGNVAEWVESARPGERAVIRGGSFGFDERMAREIAWLARRVTPRERRYRPPNVGFRLLSPIRDAADRSDAEYDQWVQDVRARAGRQAPVPRQKSAPAAPSETPEKESPPSREADGAPKAGARSWTAVPVPADPGSESGAGAAPTPSPAPAEPPAPEKEPSAPAAPSNAPPASENEPRAPDNGERGASEAPPTGPLPDAAGGSE